MPPSVPGQVSIFRSPSLLGPPSIHGRSSYKNQALEPYLSLDSNKLICMLCYRSFPSQKKVHAQENMPPSVLGTPSILSGSGYEI
jgi:hypothetical protein